MGIMKNLISDADKFLLSGLLLLFIAGCAKPSYQSDEFYEYKLKKRQVFYPEYHPGDWFAHFDHYYLGDWFARFDHDYVNEINKECFNNCEPEYQCPTIRSTLPEASRCRERRIKEHFKCYDICNEEK